jgi:hypothetical protein
MPLSQKLQIPYLFWYLEGASLDWDFLLTFAPDMRYASLMRNAGLLMALSAALFVGCKKEKDQKGPSLTVAGEPGVVTGDLTLEPNVDTTLRFKLIAQKGSGKDDADLKDYSFTVTIGGANVPIYANRPAPNGQSFTIDTVVDVTPGANGEVRRYTFTVNDKNGKSASRTFTITFRSTSSGPTLIVDSLYNGNYTNQSDNNGTHLRYQAGSGRLTLQNRTEANGNPGEILFVYWYSSTFQRHSVISPAILRDRSLYGTNPPAWDNPSTQATYFREPPASVNFATAGHADIISAYNNGVPINNEFTNNADQRAECRPGRVLAFKQGNLYGLIRVESVTSGGGATLSVKVARP